MATNKLSKGGAGGGPGSKSLGAPTQYFTGHPGMKTNPGGVAQLGQAQGNRTMTGTTSYKGDRVAMGALPKGGPGGVALGSEVALNVGGGGPGKGRTLHGQCGTQGCHGPVNPGQALPAGELFPGWPAKSRP